VAIAISAVLKNNMVQIEQATNMMETNEQVNLLRECTKHSLVYLIQLSKIPEDELFKICLEFWHFFANDVMMKTRGSALF